MNRHLNLLNVDNEKNMLPDKISNTATKISINNYIGDKFFVEIKIESSIKTFEKYYQNFLKHMKTLKIFVFKFLYITDSLSC